MSEQLICEHIDIWSSAILAKSSAGRGGNKRYELYGIKKLRELILELAVRGKLVPQDPNDEPASVLLKKIAAEKAQLIKDGKIKKQKALPKIADDEKPFELPQGWAWVRLGTLLDRISNGYSGKQDKTESSYPISRIETISKSIIDFNKVGYSTQIPEDKISHYKLHSGDILLSHINSDYHVGKTAVYCDKRILFHGINLLLLRPNQNVKSYYIDIYLNQLRFSGYFLRIAQHAIGQSSINQSKVIDILFPLPPLAEQERIVAKVDELMVLCDRLEQESEARIEAHEQLVEQLLATLSDSADASDLADNWARISEHFDVLFTSEKSIDALKQTVLQLAVMGKLVAQNPNDEPASLLLKKIAAEKAQLIKDGKIKKQKALPPITDDEKPFELPSGWEWVRLGNISTVNGGFAFKSSNYIDEGVRVIRISDFDEKGFKDGKIVRHPYSDGLRSFNLKKNDILMAMTGGTVGKSLLVKFLAEPMVVNQRVATITLFQRINPDFINSVIQGVLTQSVIQEAKNSTNDNISMGDITNFFIPFPSASEQHRIVAKVDELMALCDQLKERLQEARETQVKLTDAIVNQAL